MNVCWCYLQAELPICPLRLVLLKAALRVRQVGVSISKMRSSDIVEILALRSVCQPWRSAFDIQLQQRLAFLFQCQFAVTMHLVSTA